MVRKNENAQKFYVHEVGAIKMLQTSHHHGAPAGAGGQPQAKSGAINSLLKQVFSVKKDEPGENNQPPRKEDYTRQSPIERLTAQLVERYARRQIEMPAGTHLASYSDELTSKPHAGKLTRRRPLRAVKRNDGPPFDIEGIQEIKRPASSVGPGPASDAAEIPRTSGPRRPTSRPAAEQAPPLRNTGEPSASSIDPVAGEVKPGPEKSPAQ